MLRELTPQEWAMVSGGYDGGDIWVWGYGSIWYNDYWGSFGSGTLYDDVPPDGIASDGGGGGDDAPPPDDFCQDMEAMQAAHLISANPVSFSAEFESIIYRGADGLVHRMDPLQGVRVNTGAVSFTWDFSALYAQFDALGIARSQILGTVHNHPGESLGDNADDAALNRYPSDPDWAAADQAIAEGADPATYSIYIIDTVGELREFRYADKNLYVYDPSQLRDFTLAHQAEIMRASDQAKIRGEHLPTPVTSGQHC